MKFLLWILLLGLMFLWWLRPRKSADAGPVPGHRPAAVANAERMVRCQRCGTHVPVSEAVVSAHATFCSEEHRRQHQPKR